MQSNQPAVAWNQYDTDEESLNIPEYLTIL